MRQKTFMQPLLSVQRDHTLVGAQFYFQAESNGMRERNRIRGGEQTGDPLLGQRTADDDFLPRITRELFDRLCQRHALERQRSKIPGCRSRMES